MPDDERTVRRIDNDDDDKKRGLRRKDDDDDNAVHGLRVSGAGRANLDADDASRKIIGAVSAAMGDKKDKDDDRERMRTQVNDIGEALSRSGPVVRFTPEQEQQVNAAVASFKSTAGRVDFPQLRERLNSLQDRLNNLPSAIQALRGQGYTLRTTLENRAQAVAQQLSEVQAQFDRFVDEESRDLRRQVRQAEDQAEALEARRAEPDQALSEFNSDVQTLTSAITAAENRLGNLISAAENAFFTLNARVEQIKFVLEQATNAGFQMAAGETVYTAAKAEWDDGKDKPEGIMFITTQRVIFEQRENVGGGLFRKGEFTQKVLWEAPLNAITEVGSEDKGLFGTKDLVHLKLAPGQYFGEINFEVKQGGVDSKAWAEEIRRAQRGEFNAD